MRDGEPANWRSSSRLLDPKVSRLANSQYLVDILDVALDIAIRVLVTREEKSVLPTSRPSPRVGSWVRHGVHVIETFCRQARKGVVEVIR